MLLNVIRSVQSSSVPRNNIVSAAFNIISTVQAVEKDGAKAAIVLLDFRTAYDRVNLQYLGKMMEAMLFDPIFIAWILLLHDGGKTCLLLHKITDPIEVLFSLRQGNPISMILYVIYIEPLL